MADTFKLRDFLERDVQYRVFSKIMGDTASEETIVDIAEIKRQLEDVTRDFIIIPRSKVTKTRVRGNFHEDAMNLIVAAVMASMLSKAALKSPIMQAFNKLMRIKGASNYIQEWKKRFKGKVIAAELAKVDEELNKEWGENSAILHPLLESVLK